MASRANGSDKFSRRCPDDFEIVFVELGRVECESYYRAGRTTITRWLKGSGKAKLIKARARFVKHQIDKQKRALALAQAKPLRDRRKVEPEIVEAAAEFLRSIKNGGWAVIPCPNGDLIVGTRRRSPADVIDLAETKGFSRRRVIRQLKAERQAAVADHAPMS